MVVFTGSYYELTRACYEKVQAEDKALRKLLAGRPRMKALEISKMRLLPACSANGQRGHAEFVKVIAGSNLYRFWYDKHPELDDRHERYDAQGFSRIRCLGYFFDYQLTGLLDLVA